MQFDLIALNCRYSHSCLSLFYLQRLLQNKIPDCQTRIKQFTINEPCYDILLHLAELDSDIMFFSVYIWNSQIISRLIKDLSLVKPNLAIVLGGPQAATLGREELPPQCSTVTGAVEGLSSAFYHDLQDRKLADHYEAEKHPPFPFPYTDNDLSKELANRNIYYESSRGCPFSCSYCLSATESGVQSKEIAEVKKELDHILAHGPGIVRFVDRTFNHSTKRSLALWRYLRDKKGDTVFHFEIAPDLFTEEMFSFLETVRTEKFQFEIGIQSTNPATLKAINRLNDPKKSLANIKRLAAMDNIHLHVDLILGLPFDDINTFRRSFNQIFQSPAHYIQMGLLKLLPHTPIRKKAKKFGLQYCHQPPYQILATRWLPHQELRRLYWFGRAVEAFYNKNYFDSFFSYIKKKEEGFEFFSKLLDLCLAENFFRFAKTQDFMTKLLLKLTEKREDREIIREILCYDWLRTGKRCLPDSLATGDLKTEQKKLRNTLPSDYPPLYTRKTRNAFFKKSIFVPFSGRALQELGITERPEMDYTGICPTATCLYPDPRYGQIRSRVVCFLPEPEKTVKRLQQTVIF
ncbi:MAG: DUF4080 domain-containing protein [Thermodesulfobacteriota bacterium]